ncbi:MAG: PhzF family phenazine biosynthesis protein [Gammaproteobacteria bacterium]|nr:PhzF family phenazine biosynthesis protein [Gammaproteobacteria bacterium]
MTKNINIDLYQIKSFSENPTQGNLAGVIPAAETLSETDMQKIAEQIGASESAFILPSACADLRIRWFTPNAEVGMCIHATLAALAVAQMRGDISKEFIRVETKNATLLCHLRSNSILVHVPSYQLVSQTPLDTATLSLMPLSAAQIVETPGIVKIFDDRELIIEVRSLDDLRHLKPTQENYTSICHQLNVTGISIFTKQTLHASNQIHTREFAPLYGYLEDPLCGMAAGAIYTYLNEKNPLKVEQGYFCNTSGIIQVEPGEDSTVWIGGTYCVSAHTPNFRIATHDTPSI